MATGRLCLPEPLLRFGLTVTERPVLPTAWLFSALSLSSGGFLQAAAEPACMRSAQGHCWVLPSEMRRGAESICRRFKPPHPWWFEVCGRSRGERAAA